ncbi:unnamed protein product [Tilletia caries]|nr:unnamed protein product [Tilletia caries]
MFFSDKFCRYEAELLSTLDAPETSGDDQLRAVLPLLGEQIQAHSAATQKHVDERLKDLREDVNHGLAPPTSASASQSQSTPPVMSQDRDLSSCAERWREYKDGLRGGPSVEAMDAQWGAAWRADGKDRKHYERRMRIINKVKQLAVEKKVAERVAVVLLEHDRNQLSNKSLAKLSEHIKDGRPLAYPDLSLGDL